MIKNLSLSMFIILALSSCGSVLQKRHNTYEPPPPKNDAEAKKRLNEAGKDVVYGDTLGEIGAAVMLPPYAVYKLGQAAAGVAGYKLDATKALPKDARKRVNNAGKAVLSVPGRTAAWAAGEQYRSEGKVIKEDQ